MENEEIESFVVRKVSNGFIVETTWLLGEPNTSNSYRHETLVFEDYGAFLDYLDHIFLGIEDKEENE
jgi:hypothetical protein